MCNSKNCLFPRPAGPAECHFAPTGPFTASRRPLHRSFDDARLHKGSRREPWGVPDGRKIQQVMVDSKNMVPIPHRWPIQIRTPLAMHSPIECRGRSNQGWISAERSFTPREGVRFHAPRPRADASGSSCPRPGPEHDPAAPEESWF